MQAYPTPEKQSTTKQPGAGGKKFHEFFKSKNGRTIVLLLILAAAAALRYYKLVHYEIWFDESCMVLIARSDLSEILNGKALDVYPPLYFLLLHFLLKVADPLLMLRLPSMLSGTFSLLFIFLIARKLFNTRIAYFAIAMSILNPFQFYYAREGKIYALLTFMCLIYVYLFLKLKESPDDKKTWTLFTVTFIILPYMHYIAASIPLAAFIYILVNPRLPEKFKRRFFLSALAAVIAFLPWIRILIIKINQTLASENITFIPPLSLKRIVSLFYVFASGFNSPLIADYVVSILTFIFFLKGLSAFRRYPKKTLFIFLLFIVPPLLITIFSIFLPMFMERYVIYSGIFYIILSAYGVASLRSRVMRIGIISVFVVLNALAVSNTYQNKMPYQARNPSKFFPATPRRPFRNICGFINESYREGDAVLHFLPQTSLPCRFYLKENIPSYPTTLHPDLIAYEGFKDLGEKIGDYPVPLWEIFPDYERFWLIESYWGVAPDKTVPACEINQWLSSHCVLLDEKRLWDIDLRLYEKHPVFEGADKTKVLADKGALKLIELEEPLTGQEDKIFRYRTLPTVHDELLENIMSIETLRHDNDRFSFRVTNVSDKIIDYSETWKWISGILEAESMNIYPSKVLTWWIPIWRRPSIPSWGNTVMLSQEIQRLKNEPNRKLEFDLRTKPGNYALFVRMPFWNVSSKETRAAVSFFLNDEKLTHFVPVGYGPYTSMETVHLGNFHSDGNPQKLSILGAGNEDQKVAWLDIDRFFFVNLENCTFLDCENAEQLGTYAHWFLNNSAIESPHLNKSVMTVETPPQSFSNTLSLKIDPSAEPRELWARMPGLGHYAPGLRAEIHISVTDQKEIKIVQGMSSGIHRSGFIRLARLYAGRSYSVDIKAYNPYEQKNAFADADFLLLTPVFLNEQEQLSVIYADCFSTFNLNRSVLKPQEFKEFSVALSNIRPHASNKNDLLRIDWEEFGTKTDYCLQFPVTSQP